MEGEVFLLGHWKNFEELEENLSLPELQLILDSYREVKHRDNKFAAALKGIDLDEGSQSENQRRLDEIKRKVWVEQYGQKAVNQHEFFELGLEIEVEE